MFNPQHRIRRLGQGLNRPECVLTHKSGRAFTSCWEGNGGVSIIQSNGRVQHLLCKDVSLRPNGIALQPDGCFLLAHLGDETGGIFRLYNNGETEVVLDQLNGTVLPPTNFVFIDSQDRTWITVSTRSHPRAKAYRADIHSGFIILLDQRGARIVADGLGYTNECAVSPDGGTLYVNETFGRRLTAYSIHADGTLSHRKTVATFDAGTYPDGLSLDESGALWITSILSNRLIRIGTDGRSETVLQDADETALERAEQAFVSNQLSRKHLDVSLGHTLNNISSLAFGGPERSTGYLGCLLDDCIYQVELPSRGMMPVHWDARLPSSFAE